MKYKGIEIGTPTVDQIQECINSFGFRISAQKLYDIHARHNWNIRFYKPQLTLEDLVYKSRRKKSVQIHDKSKRKYLRRCKTEKQKEYNKLLQQKEWKDFRKLVFKERGRKCEKCGRESNLQIHHTQYRKGWLPWEYPMSMIKVLCRGCHASVHHIKTH